MYGLAAVDYIQRNISPKSYQVNLYVDNGKWQPAIVKYNLLAFIRYVL